MDEKTDSRRRTFIQGAGAAAAMSAVSLSLPRWGGPRPSLTAEDTAAIRAEIKKRHDESLKRLQTWIRQPSIAAENRGMNEGCQLMMDMLDEAGFTNIRKVPTDGQPG
ncbi:MAG TPA: twin-arginine translocation signal domain-containing protein, partial [Candidatus Saccharimonadales bacterium]|nr:twin-arginine translocation signal domain-containing protein [Candidatus Saccharimonadales bacterium]